MGTVLVTGGAGFVGSYVVRDLLRQGNDVVVYDSHPTQNTLDLVLPLGERQRLSVGLGSVTDGWRLLHLAQSHHVDRIVHLASPLTQDVVQNPGQGIADMCIGTNNVFEVARVLAIRRVVWTSSVAVFGSASHYPPGPLPNDADHAPTTLYGSCKSLCENLARQAFLAHGVDNVGLRLSVVYGAGRLRGYMSYPSHLIRAADNGEPFDVPHGATRLNWQYVEEVSTMITHVLDSGACGEGSSYNTYGDARTYREAVDVLRRHRPHLLAQVSDSCDPTLEDVVIEYDDTRFRREFGYQPQWPLERGVVATLDAYGDMTRLAEPTAAEIVS